MSEDVKQMNLWQRIHHAGEELKGRVAKDKTNTFDKYDYASHDGVVAHVRPALQAARIVLTIEPGDFSVDTVETNNKTQILVKGLMQAVLHNIDKPEDVYSIPIPVMALDRGDKAHGKAISYGKKYAITACIGLLLATGEDTDSGEEEITQPEKAKHTAQPKPKTEDAARKVAKQNLWKTANQHGYTTPEAIEEYAVAIGMNLPLKDMTAKDMNTLEGKIILNHQPLKKEDDHG